MKFPHLCLILNTELDPGGTWCPNDAYIALFGEEPHDGVVADLPSPVLAALNPTDTFKESAVLASVAREWASDSVSGLADCAVDVAKNVFQQAPAVKTAIYRWGVLVDAVWKTADKKAQQGSVVDQLRLPMLARLRFLAWSAPFRWPNVSETGNIYERTRWCKHAAKAREARAVWFEYLREFDRHPALVRSGLDPTTEAELLVFSHRDVSKGRQLNQASLVQERSFLILAIRELFLARFAVRETAGATALLLALPRNRDPKGAEDKMGVRLLSQARRASPWPMLLTPVLLAAGGIGTRLSGWDCWLWLIGAAFAFALVAAIWVGPLFTYPYCLRMAAAAGIGQSVVTAAPDGWDAPRSTVIIASVFLAVAAVLYLVLEARMHGSTGWKAVCRGLVVGAIGGMHSIVLASLVWQFLAPITAGVGVLSEVASPTAFLFFLTAAGLAAGVLLQLLWEDRAVTYPLVHLEGAR